MAVRIETRRIPCYPGDPWPWYAVALDKRTGRERACSGDYEDAAAAVAAVVEWAVGNGEEYEIVPE